MSSGSCMPTWYQRKTCMLATLVHNSLQQVTSVPHIVVCVLLHGTKPDGTHFQGFAMPGGLPGLLAILHGAT